MTKVDEFQAKLAECREYLKNENGGETDPLVEEAFEKFKNTIEFMQQLGELDELEQLDDFDVAKFQEAINRFPTIKQHYDLAENELEKIQEENEYQRFLEKLSAEKGIVLPQLVTVNNATQIAPPDTQQPSVKLSEAIKCYGHQMLRGNNWSENTHKEQTASLKLFLEFVGDVPVNGITKGTIVDFKNILAVFPKNRNKKQYKTVSLNNISALNLNKKEIITPQTQKKNLQRIQQLLAWCVSEALCETNVAEMVKVHGKIEIKSFEEFSTDELKIIFNTINSKKQQLKLYQYWIPYLLLYTGARLNEICQLYKSDVVKKDSIWCFDFNDDGEDKSLKNKPSKRIIPIPDVLLQLKFMEFIKNIPANNRIFSELHYYEKGGYGRDPSKWFTAFLKEIGVVGKQKKGFHSFRNNVTNVLFNTDTSEPMVNAIIGHTNKTESYTTYKGKMKNMKLLQGIINQISFDI